MANPNETPEQVTPTVVGGVEEYNSSEELARAHRQTFVQKEKEAEQQAHLTEKQKLHKVLDRYIKKYGSTKDVREMATKAKRTADYQLDLSADLIGILEKIKNELR